MVPGVLEHPRFRSRNYLIPFLAFFVSAATGEGAGAGVGASGHVARSKYTVFQRTMAATTRFNPLAR